MQTKDVPVYYEADAKSQQVTLVFFSDLPSVPYMAIDDFYATFLHGKMNVSSGDNGVFTLMVEDGTTATANTDADTLAVDDFTAFVSQPLLKGVERIVQARVWPRGRMLPRSCGPPSRALSGPVVQPPSATASLRREAPGARASDVVRHRPVGGPAWMSLSPHGRGGTVTPTRGR